MAASINRRDWLKKNSLAALALGFALPSMANEEGMTRAFGSDLGLLNLGSNENPYGISPKAKEALVAMAKDSNRYQFNVPALQSFEKELADYNKVGDNQILVTAGSGDALMRLGRHFNKGNLVTATPTFAALPNTAKKMGTRVIEVPLTKEKTHDLPAMLRAMDADTRLVYICNPANPSSTIVPAQQLREFCKEASKKAVVVIDEAYIDFLDQPETQSMVGLINAHPNILVVRTFSKIHAMAGLRVGYTIGHPSLIGQLEDNYFSNAQITVSNVSLAAAMASLKDEKHLLDCKQKNEAVRDFSIQALKNFSINCIPSHTNFIFFQLGNYPGNFAQDMLSRKAIVRSDNYTDGKWARVSLGTMEEMKHFIGIMKTVWRG